MPGWALDNMPNFQIGIQTALARFATEMADQIGRSRASASADQDLQDARGLLNYAPNKWYIDSASLTANSESQYLAAMVKLQNYNNRLSQGRASFEPRADNLIATLDRIGKDLGGASDKVDRQIDEFSGIGTTWRLTTSSTTTRACSTPTRFCCATWPSTSRACWTSAAPARSGSGWWIP